MGNEIKLSVHLHQRAVIIIPVRRLVSEGVAKVQCRNTIRREREPFMVKIMKQISQYIDFLSFGSSLESK